MEVLKIIGQHVVVISVSWSQNQGFLIVITGWPKLIFCTWAWLHFNRHLTKLDGFICSSTVFHLLSLCSNHDLVGLQHIIECVCSGNPTKAYYLCTLCKLSLPSLMIIKHVLSFDHIHSYFVSNRGNHACCELVLSCEWTGSSIKS